MKDFKTFSRVIFVLYRFVLPACILFFLLIVSQNLKRPLFLGSLGFDFFARIWIAFGFCYLYIVLSDIDGYIFRAYRIHTENSNDHNLPINWRNIILGCTLGAISIPITWWVIQFFLPIFSSISWLLALFDGLLLSFPIIVRRNKFIL